MASTHIEIRNLATEKVHYRKVWLISACAYVVSGKYVCAYYTCALCKTRVRRIQGPAQPKHYTGLQCVRFSQQQSSTDLHAVACNLNAGAKFRASHYTARLFADSVDYLGYM